MTIESHAVSLPFRERRHANLHKFMRVLSGRIESFGSPGNAGTDGTFTSSSRTGRNPFGSPSARPVCPQVFPNIHPTNYCTRLRSIIQSVSHVSVCGLVSRLRQVAHTTCLSLCGAFCCLLESPGWRSPFRREPGRVAHLCIAPFPRPHPCVFRKGGRRCCRRNPSPFYTALCVCRRRTRPFRPREGRGTRICGGFCSLKAGPPAPPTLRFPERTGVALGSDLAHDNHQNSNFLFHLR